MARDNEINWLKFLQNFHVLIYCFKISIQCFYKSRTFNNGNTEETWNKFINLNWFIFFFTQKYDKNTMEMK